jgi:hypothetical protein
LWSRLPATSFPPAPWQCARLDKGPPTAWYGKTAAVRLISQQKRLQHERQAKSPSYLDSGTGGNRKILGLPERGTVPYGNVSGVTNRRLDRFARMDADSAS